MSPPRQQSTPDTWPIAQWPEYRRVRQRSEAICAPLLPEDCVVQSMQDVSPPKWHLAHVSWFFETFLLRPYLPGYRVFDPLYETLFNSYYQSQGEPFPRARRGVLSRPSLEQVMAYRAHVDRGMGELFADTPSAHATEISRRLQLGLEHERQHQELLLMDILHILAQNPLRPVYREDLQSPCTTACPMSWQAFPAGVQEIGAQDDRFAFDCERPRHRVFLEAFELASRPVSNAEYLHFIEDGSYARSEWWLSEGWDLIRCEGWQAPLYRERDGSGWGRMTLAGWQPVEAEAPVCHLSFYEADAYARWAGARLPSEAEWELAAADATAEGNCMESDILRPQASPGNGLRQLLGDVWEWTASAFRPYPGFRPLEGGLGEYNGKFMCGQMVLRGGSCVTPAAQLRAADRNFFYPQMRWAFAGLRLARDL